MLFLQNVEFTIVTVGISSVVIYFNDVTLFSKKRQKDDTLHLQDLIPLLTMYTFVINLIHDCIYLSALSWAHWMFWDVKSFSCQSVSQF